MKQQGSATLAVLLMIIGATFVVLTLIRTSWYVQAIAHERLHTVQSRSSLEALALYGARVAITCAPRVHEHVFPLTLAFDAWPVNSGTAAQGTIVVEYKKNKFYLTARLHAPGQSVGEISYRLIKKMQFEKPVFCIRGWSYTRVAS